MSVPLQSPLFRQEVLDHKRDTWLGEILLVRPTSFGFLAVVSLAVALGALAYLVWGEYTKKARVSGYLVPDQGLIKIYPQQAGAVAVLQAREGQSVRKGDVLAIVSTERTSVQGSTQLEIAKQLDVRRRSLIEEKAKIHQQFATQTESARVRMSQLRQEMDQLSRTLEAQEQRVFLSERVVERNTQLVREKFVSEAALQDKQAELLDQQNRLRELRRSRISVERESVSLQADLRNLPIKERSEIAALERSISELESAGAENEARRESYVLAPEDGLVTALQVDRGKQANPGLPLMSLIPSGARLQADLYIPSRAVGFVRVGSTARLQYQAFPYQKFGTHPGQVTKVSRTAIAAQELPFPASPADIYYVVTVRPEKDVVLAYGKTEHLQSGMQVDADIWLDRRTLLEWILEPLYSVSGRV